MWNGRQPDLKYLKIFGATVFSHTEFPTGKFDKRCSIGVLVGLVSNGYKIWNIEKHKYENVRNVEFDEETFILTRK